MSGFTITYATETLNEIIYALDDAYWEAGTIEYKDAVYNVQRVFTEELIELHKVSVQDGDYKYEPVNEGLRNLAASIAWMRENLSVVCRRTHTQHRVAELLQRVQPLLQ